MRNIIPLALLMICCLGDTGYCASLLQPQSFPKTVNDLTFVQKVALKQDAYEPWETIYDNSGRCVSGCAYQGITIQEDMAMSNRHTIDAWNRVQQYISTQQSQQSQQPQKIGSTTQITSSVRSCVPSNTDTPEHQKLPFGIPLIGDKKITSGYGLRYHPVTGEKSKHSGVDLAASVGTDVFSPADGTVTDVWTDATCGNGLKISHAADHETVYCHLNKVVVNPGDRVDAGCKVAETGNTGRTTGPHLHYAVKENGSYVNPISWINGNG